MRRILFFLLAIAFHLPSFTQSNYQFVIGKNTYNSAGTALIQLDSNIIVAGATQIGPTSNEDFLISKISKESRTVFSIAANGADASNTQSIDRFTDIIYNLDKSAFYLTGETSPKATNGIVHRNIVVTRVNTALSTASMITLGDTSSTTSAPINEAANSICLDYQGYPVVAGFTQTSGVQDGLVICSDNLGLLKWSLPLNIPNNGDAKDIIKDHEDNLIVVGMGTNSATGTEIDAFIYKLDKNGSYTYGKYFGKTGNNEWFKAIYQSPIDNSYWIVGGMKETSAGSKENMLIVRLNSDLSVVFSRIIQVTGNIVATDITPDFENNYVIVAGVLENVAGNKEACLLKIDKEGNISWSKHYGGTKNEEISRVITGKNKDFIAVGTTNSPEFLSAFNNVYMLIADKYGDIKETCNQDTLTTNSNDYGLSVANPVNLPTSKSIKRKAGSFSYNVSPMVTKTYCLNAYIPLKALAGKDTSICAGQTVILGAFPITNIGGKGPYRYSWTPVASVSNDTLPHPIASPSTTTSFVLKVTDDVNVSATDNIVVSMNTDSSDFTGLDTTYCTSSMFDILKPKQVGGVFYGNGINFNGVDWYFKPEEAGPGLHDICYISKNACDTTCYTAKVNPAPCISSVVKDTTAGSVTIPQGIFTNCTGDIYLTNKSYILMIDTFGITHLIAGQLNSSGYKDGPALDSAKMDLPSGLVLLPNGTIYFCDNSNHSVRMVRNDSVFTIAGALPPLKTAGTTDNVIGVNARFDGPYGIVYDQIRNCLYISESGLNRIRKIDLTPGNNYFTSTIAGGGSTDVSSSAPIAGNTAKLYQIRHMSLNGDNIYITDYDKRVVYYLNLATNQISRYSGVYSIPGSNDGARLTARYTRPIGTSINCNNTIYVTDEAMNSVRVIRDNTVSTYPDDNYLINTPQGISVFVKGYLDIANKGNNDILRLTISDWTVGPWIGLDTSDFTYCLGEGADTLNPIYNCGTYSSPTPGVITFDAGINKYIFTPPSLPGDYVLTYNYQVGFCPASVSKVIRVRAYPVATIGGIKAICAGDKATLDAGAGYKAYKWSTGAITRVIQPTLAGLYSVTVTDFNNCKDDTSTNVQSHPKPIAEAGSAITVCALTTVKLGGAPTGSGGTAPLKYQWIPNTNLNSDTLANPDHHVNVGSNYYRVTVTDVNGCFGKDSVLVTGNPLPIAKAGKDTTICNGTTTILGGTPTGPLGSTYRWRPSNYVSDSTIANPTTNALLPLGSTTFIVRVTNSGCSKNDTIVITKVANPTINAGVDDTICIGSNKIIGGTPTGPAGSSYAWSNAATLDNASFANPTATPTINTTYTVTVTDINKCKSTDAVILRVSSITASAGVDKFLCPGDSVQIGGTPAVSGSLGVVTYRWSPKNKVNDSTVANPFAKTVVDQNYILTTKDAAGCKDTDTMKVSMRTKPVASVPFSDSTICPGDTIRISSSFAYTSYKWTPNTYISSNTIINPKVYPNFTTTYTLQVTDINGCKDDTTVKVSVDNPVVSINPSPDTLICKGDTIDLKATASGALSYAWSPAIGLSAIAGASVKAFPLVSTTYTVKVTRITGCPAVDTVRVLISNLKANAGLDKQLCKGDTADLGGSPTASGGSGGYSYAWSSPATLLSSSIANPKSKTLASLYYRVTVTDSKGCNDTNGVYVKVNSLPTATVNFYDSTVCKGGDSLQLSGSGGSNPQWSPSAGLSSTSTYGPKVYPAVTTTYTFTITSINGCKNDTTVKINVDNPLISVSPTLSTTICKGDTVTLTANAAGALSYSWTPVAGLLSTTGASVQANPALTTTYKVTAARSNGCPAIDTIRVILSNLKANAGLDQQICKGDTADLGGLPTATGGAGGYTFAWTNPASLILPTNANPKSKTLVSFYYRVTVTDAMGCTDTNGVKITVNPLPTASVSFSDTTVCSQGDTLQLTGSGGVNPKWTPATGLTGTSILNPKAWPIDTIVYTFAIENAFGCKDDTTLTINAVQIPVFISKPLADTLICSKQAVQLLAGSAIGGLSYSWLPNKWISAIAIPNPITTPDSTITYIVTATLLPQNCKGRDTVIINVSNGLIANAGNDSAICFGSSVVVGGATVATGGVSPYTYSWSPTGSLSNAAIAKPTATPLVLTKYYLTLKDLANCSANDSITISINPLPTVDAGITDTLCYGEKVFIGGSPTANGTVGPYIYSWLPIAALHKTDTSNPLLTNANVGITNIASTYTVLATDNTTKCSANDSIRILLLPKPGLLDSTVSVCAKDTLLLSAYGGTAYIWYPATALSSTNQASVLANPTTNIVYNTIISGPGCAKDTLQTQVTVIALPNVTASADTSLFIGEEIELLAVSSETNFEWQPQDYMLTTNTIANPRVRPEDSINYIVTVTNPANCKNSDTVRISLMLKYDLFVPSAFAPDGNINENKKLCIKQVGMKKVHLRIYNRWGELVFETEDMNECWDGSFKGQMQQLQTFGYIVEAEDYSGKTINRKGTVTIIK